MKRYRTFLWCGFAALIATPFVVGTPEPTFGACCFPHGFCEILSEAQCEGNNGVYQGDGVSCFVTECPLPCPADVDRSGAIDATDLLHIIAAWGACEE